MTTIESDKLEINSSSEDIFKFLGDFNNFEELMPSQVTNFESTKDECSFTLQGMAVIGMSILDRIPNTEIKIGSTKKSPFRFSLNCTIENIDEKKCNTQLIFEAELNPMMMMMVKSILQNLFDMITKKLKEINE